MLAVYTVLVILVFFLVLLNIPRVWSANFNRSYGGRPFRKNRATMFDVRYLLMEGEKDLAIKLYCEIFNTTSPAAKKDIEELQRSLRV